MKIDIFKHVNVVDIKLLLIKLNSYLLKLNYLVVRINTKTRSPLTSKLVFFLNPSINESFAFASSEGGTTHVFQFKDVALIHA